MAPCSSILAWEIPWTEEPGRLQSMRLKRVGHDSSTEQQQYKMINNKNLLCSTQNYTQYFVITYNGKESGREQSMGSKRVRHDWRDWAHMHTHIFYIYTQPYIYVNPYTYMQIYVKNTDLATEQNEYIYIYIYIIHMYYIYKWITLLYTWNNVNQLHFNVKKPKNLKIINFLKRALFLWNSGQSSYSFPLSFFITVVYWPLCQLHSLNTFKTWSIFSSSVYCCYVGYLGCLYSTVT